MRLPRLALSNRQWLLILLTASFLFTSGYALHFKIVPAVDARTYDRIATNIAHGNGYRIDASVPSALDKAIGSVGPGYEFFLAFLFRVFGHVLPIVWVVQTLLYLGTALFIFLIARRVFPEEGERAGLIGAGLYLFCIDIIQMPAMLMTETLYLFLLTLTVYAFVRFYAVSTYANAAFLGIACALAIMTRPTTLFVLILVIAYTLVKRRFGQASLIALIVVLLMAPWAVRNYYTYDTFIWSTAAGGYDLWMGNNPQADGGAHPTQEIVDYLAAHGYVATDPVGTREAESFALHHPLSFLRLLWVKTVAYFSVARPYAFWFYLSGLPQKIVLVWSAAWSFLLLVSGFAGAWLLLRSRGPLAHWVLALAVLMPLSVIPIIVETRYRLPLYPFLALFGGYAAARFWNAWHTRNPADTQLIFGVVAVATALVVLIAAVDVWHSLPVILEHLRSL